MWYLLKSSGASLPFVYSNNKPWPKRRTGAKTLPERRLRSNRSGSWSLRQWRRLCIQRIWPHYLNTLNALKRFAGAKTLQKRNNSISKSPAAQMTVFSKFTTMVKFLQVCHPKRSYKKDVSAKNAPAVRPVWWISQRYPIWYTSEKLAETPSNP